MTDSHSDLFQNFAQRCSRLGIAMPEAELDAYRKYCAELAAYNSKVNLVADADTATVLQAHVLDSLTLAPVIREQRSDAQEKPTSLVDIGSGAGFPGLILAIHFPLLRVLLIESISKKARFLQEAVGNLGLQDRVTVMAERAEKLAHRKELRGKFDFATARAVGSLPLVVELSAAFLKQGGMLLAQRSAKQLQEELITAPATASRFSATVNGCTYPDKEILMKDVGILEIELTGRIPDALPRSGGKLGT